MRKWPAREAEARFGELLELCIKEGPQTVTRHGTDAAVPLPMREWQRLQRSAQPTLKELLLAPTPRGDIPLPKRGRACRRSLPDLT